MRREGAGCLPLLILGWVGVVRTCTVGFVQEGKMVFEGVDGLKWEEPLGWTGSICKWTCGFGGMLGRGERLSQGIFTFSFLMRLSLWSSGLTAPRIGLLSLENGFLFCLWHLSGYILSNNRKEVL